MKIYTTQAEVEKDIKDGVLTIEGDVRFECSISINASIKVIAGNITARDINARDITAVDINAWNITAGNITARDITAVDINAWNITARDINAWNITAGDINARDITARDINAGDILYYAFCCVYNSIKCISIKTKRDKYQEPICLGGKLEFKKESTSIIGQEVEVKMPNGKTYKAKVVSEESN